MNSDTNPFPYHQRAACFVPHVMMCEPMSPRISNPIDFALVYMNVVVLYMLSQLWESNPVHDSVIIQLHVEESVPLGYDIRPFPIRIQYFRVPRY